jgi:hypothetical protein
MVMDYEKILMKDNELAMRSASWLVIDDLAIPQVFGRFVSSELAISNWSCKPGLGIWSRAS